jgi:hypothetical protein
MHLPALARLGLGLLLCAAPGCRSRGGAPDTGGLDLAEPGPGPGPGDDEDLLGPGAQDLRGGGGTEDLRGGGMEDLRAPFDPDLRPAGMDLRPPADMSMARPPCKAPGATGFAAFRFKYVGSTSASVEVFGLPDRSNFEAVPAYATSFVDVMNGGGINIAGGNWLLIRYSVVGLSRISGATLSIYGRSYSVSSSGSFEAWSPIYGGKSTPANSFSNAWPYRWSSLDFTGLVAIGDPPGLTGIRLYARPGSSNLVINTVELCIDGS